MGNDCRNLKHVYDPDATDNEGDNSSYGSKENLHGRYDPLNRGV